MTDCSKLDLRSRAGFDEWLRVQLGDVRDEWNACGGGPRFPPRAVLLATVNPRNGQPLSTPMVVVAAPTMDFDGPAKTAFAETLRRMAAQLGAIASIIVAEAWTLRQESGEELPRGGIAKHPQRQEIVFATVDHRTTGECMWVADISREGDEPVLGEFLLLDAKVDAGGRFSRIIPERTLS